MHGAEYDELKEAVDSYKDKFESDVYKRQEEAKEVLAEILRMHGKRAGGMASGGGDLMKNSVPEENGKELQKEETAAESVKALAEDCLLYTSRCV